MKTHPTDSEDYIEDDRPYLYATAVEGGVALEYADPAGITLKEDGTAISLGRYRAEELKALIDAAESGGGA